MGRDDVRQYVEGSDCVILLGAFMTDINLGVYPARLDLGRSIYATSEKLSIRYHTYEDVRFKDFMRGLLRLRVRRRTLGRIPHPPAVNSFHLKNGRAKLTVKSLFERINAYLSDDTIVVVDVGDAMFGATDLFIRHRTEFLGPAYYASMGFAVPAGGGAPTSNPNPRPPLLVRRGPLHITGFELCTP